MTDTEKQRLAKLIYEHVEDTEYRYHMLPHTGLINDWFLSYVELSRLVRQYFGNDRVDSYVIDEDKLK